MKANKDLKPLLKVIKLQKPKASKGAFLFFSREMRKKLIEDNPEMSFQEISAELSKIWDNLSFTDKEYYKELSEYDKCRFKEEKRIFRQELNIRILKALRDGTLSPSLINQSFLTLKPAQDASKFYFRHIKPMLIEKAESDSAQSLIKPLSIMWNSLNSVQSIPFHLLAKEDFERASDEKLIYQEILQYSLSEYSDK